MHVRMHVLHVCVCVWMHCRYVHSHNECRGYYWLLRGSSAAMVQYLFALQMRTRYKPHMTFRVHR
jgi:hypothetical protein